MQLTYNISTYDEALAALPEQDITLVGVPGVSEPIKWSKRKIYGRPSRGVFEIQFGYEDVIYYYSNMSDDYGWNSHAVEPDPTQWRRLHSRLNRCTALP